MRGRTNVLGFSEDFINADIVDAVADESILSGNFVKFYNAVNGGITMGGVFGIVKELSDGRYMCVGIHDNALGQHKIYVVILEKDSDGNFTQNLPDIETNIQYYYDNNDLLPNSTVDIDDDTIAILGLSGSLVSDTAMVSLGMSFLHFDVLTNQISQNDVSNYVRNGTTGTITQQFEFKYSSYNGTREFYVIADGYSFSFVKIGNVLYLSAYVSCCYIPYGGTTRYYSNSVICMKVSVNSSLNTFLINYSRCLSSIDYATDSLSQYYLLSSVYTDDPQGCFILTTEGASRDTPSYISGYSLYYVSLANFESNNAIPEKIVFTNDFSDSGEIILLGFYNNYLYLMYNKDNGSYNSAINWFKIYFYNYTREGYSYLIYDSVDVAIYLRKPRNGSIGSTYFRVSVNISFLYENNDVKRFCISGIKYNTNNELIFLVDIDKTNNSLVFNPAIESAKTITYPVSNPDKFYCYVGFLNLFNVYDSVNNKFILPSVQDLIEFEIVDDSELSGGVSNIRHVQNAVNENYIMGVARQSGSAGDVIECYKARVT